MNKDLQAIARMYLKRLRNKAQKRGLLPWVDETIKANKDNRCKATEIEVRMLSRLCDDERLKRKDVPSYLDKSYRRCFEDDDFEKIKTLPTHGIYDKISVLLLAMKLKKRNKDGNKH